MNCRYCGGLLVQTSGPDLCMNLQCPGPVVQQPTEADALREELATHLRVHLGVVNDNIALRAEVAALKLTIENLRAFALFTRANMVDTLRVQDELYAALEAGREMPARDEPSAAPRTLA